jgi:hypothetical protein
MSCGLVAPGPPDAHKPPGHSGNIMFERLHTCISPHDLKNLKFVIICYIN